MRFWNFTNQDLRLGSSTAKPIPADGYCQIVPMYERGQGAVLDLGDGTAIPGKRYSRGAMALSAPWIKGTKDYNPEIQVSEGDVIIINKAVAEFAIDSTLQLDVAVEVWVPGVVERDAGVTFAPCPEFYADLSPAYH